MTQSCDCQDQIVDTLNDVANQTGDYVEQSLYDALLSVGITDSNLLNLADEISNLTNCDYECEKLKLLARLQKLYNINNTEEDINEIKAIKYAREWYTIYNPTTAIDEFESNYVFDGISDEWIEVSNDFINVLYDLSLNYNSLYGLYEKFKENSDNYSVNALIENIINEKNEELKKIKTNIGNYAKLTNIDMRKAYYTSEDLEMYKNIYNYLLIIYYILFIIYLAFGDFKNKSRYKDKIFYIVAITYLLFPYILKYLMRGILKLYNYILEKYNIKKPVYSYTDLIQAANVDKLYSAPMNNADSVDQANLNYYYTNFNTHYSSII